MRGYVKNAARWLYRAKEQLVQRLADQNYHTARAYYMYKRRRANRRYQGQPLVIYQVGKVGSKTVRSSLKALDLDMPIYHAHFLTPEPISEYVEKRKAYFRTEKHSLLTHVWLYEYLREQIDRGLDSTKWQIVTLTREPVGRNISEFFENIDIRPEEGGSRYRITSAPDFYDFDVLVSSDDTSPLVDLFLGRLDHDGPLQFFDSELKRVFGVDVYSRPFPAAKGYDIYRGEIADVLLIRLENLNACAAEAFQAFLGIEGLTLINENVGDEKPYAHLYQQFRSSVVLPRSYLDKMYDARYTRHFYTDQEIEDFRARWRISG